MSPRPYRSQSRRAGSEKTRERIIDAAMDILSSEDGLAAFSAEAVARRAGVARMTVYYQFGSRGGLLEAAFDAQAARRGLSAIAEAFRTADPAEGILVLVRTFCRFWSSAPPAMQRLHWAAGLDPEIEERIRARNERRRQALRGLIDKLVAGGRLDAGKSGDVVDRLFVLTSASTYYELIAGGRRTGDEVQAVLEETVSAVLKRWVQPAGA
jgi:AcrR family transcriptional regulator